MNTKFYVHRIETIKVIYTGKKITCFYMMLLKDHVDSEHGRIGKGKIFVSLFSPSVTFEAKFAH